MKNESHICLTDPLHAPYQSRGIHILQLAGSLWLFFKRCFPNRRRCCRLGIRSVIVLDLQSIPHVRSMCCWRPEVQRRGLTEGVNVRAVWVWLAVIKYRTAFPGVSDHVSWVIKVCRAQGPLATAKEDGKATVYCCELAYLHGSWNRPTL